jgi:shikimate dehydrogenase
MMYKNEDTSFVRWAKKNGAILAVDGLGMLVEQAAESFFRWRGVRPETGSVIANLKNQQ